MIVAIVLAAGSSRRMGPQKLLLPIQGKPLITRIVDEVLASPVDQVVVVVGEDRAEIRQALAGRNVGYAFNPQAGGEMLDSVRQGLLALPREARGALVVLGDQPGISRTVIAELVRGFDRGGRLVVPTFEGKRGHPLLLSTDYRDEVLRTYDDVGLRGLLRAHSGDVLEVAVSLPDVLEDMDTPDDYRRIHRNRD